MNESCWCGDHGKDGKLVGRKETVGSDEDNLLLSLGLHRHSTYVLTRYTLNTK